MRHLIGLHLPKIVFVMALAPGLAMTVALHHVGERRLQAEFERSAHLAIDRVTSRLDRHAVVLRAARGLLTANRGNVSRDEFVRFLTSVDMTGDLAGIQGVGLARMLSREDSGYALSEIFAHYGIQGAVRPETDQSWRTPIILLEPANPRNVAALGFDMYADPTRRSAMDHAIASGDAQMSGPVELVQEITSDKQYGFLIYLPLTSVDYPAGLREAPVPGFVYAPFRGKDLIDAALASGPALPVTLRVVDTASPLKPLYEPDPATSVGSLQIQRSAVLFGRQWSFEVRSDPASTDLTRYLAGMSLTLISVFFAAASAFAVSSRQAEAAQARKVANAAEREAAYRALSLQEMKHRIKNHIARIQSIARQSARGATDVKAFTAAFDARLHAMAALQDILAGTASASANIHEILAMELRQSREASQIARMLDGPVVQLDERRAHAFALAVHELVTNAMKYGALSEETGGLHISWKTSPATATSIAQVEIDWVETGATLVPEENPVPGFGVKLIDASIKGELSGRIDREFTPGRLHIRISFPQKA